MGKIIKHIIFIIIMILLTLPMVQRISGLFDEGNLNGDFVLATLPVYTTQNWMDGKFQAGLDRYTEDHIGFRNFFVRLNNQIDFSLFDKINAEGLVKGKHSVLYEYDYIRAYTGGDFIGKDVIDHKMGKLKFLQEHLKKQFDIDLILIFEPSKARVEPQYIPDSYLKDGMSLSNYEYFKQKANDLSINYVDLNKYLKEVGDTSRYPVYPPYGIHWSEFTMGFITDTLTKLIEAQRGIDMPDFTVDTHIVPDSISSSDYDAGMTSNLLFRLPQHELPYPFFTFKNEPDKQRPMVLAVADSYYWNIFNTRLPKHLFANEAFWYFNAKVYPDFYYGEKWTRDLDTKAEVEKQDVILLGITERFLYKFAWEFVEQLFDIYGPKYTGDIVENYEDQIRNYSVMFDRIYDTAVATGKNLDSLIRGNAIDLAVNKDFDTYLTWYGPEYFRHMIASDKPWNDAVRAKAARNNMDYEVQLDNEAIYQFRKDKPEIFHKYETIRAYIDSISYDESWMELIRQKAHKFYLPVDEMVKIDAEYMAFVYLKNETPFDRRVRHFEEVIRNTPDWLQQVKEKAKQKNIPVEKMIRMDATYTARQEQLKHESQDE